MNNSISKTPVVLIIFNRPDCTKKVFESIRQAKPSKIMVIADGPRSDKAVEKKKCEEARAIIETVDWDCEVLKNYSDTNMGCKKRVSSGLDWVFENEEEAIILEDDCLPHPSFFPYCETMLERYRDDTRIMMISGANFQFGHTRSTYSYYFSRFNHVWGWASWRRAWKYYDVKLELWPMIRDGRWMNDILLDNRTVKYWTNIFETVYQGQIDTWDYQWTFACWIQNGLTLLPNSNLISNIGFGVDATHTIKIDKTANIPTIGLDFPLKDPPFVVQDVKADANTSELFFNKSLRGRLKNRTDDLLEFIRKMIQPGAQR